MELIKQKLTIMFLAFNGVLCGQVDNSILSGSVPQFPQIPESFYFHFENLNFIKNNEYFNRLEEGRTLIGYYLTPCLDYNFSEMIKIRGGVHLLKYSGTDNFSQLLPVFSIYHAVNEQLCLIFGSIQSSLFHSLPEPDYRFERLIENHVENGIQLIYKNPVLFSDTWLNWENFINDNDSEQEKFTAGSSWCINLNKNIIYRISAPLNLTVRHRGGQVNKDEANIQTISNTSAGLRFDVFPESSPWKINSLGTEFIVFGYKDFSFHHELPYTSGYACYLTGNIKTRYLQIGAGYWNSYHYYSPLGEQLFQSISLIDRHYTDAEKKLAVTKIQFSKIISQKSAIILRFESYYDIPNDLYDYSYGIYLKLDADILFKKMAKPEK